MAKGFRHGSGGELRKVPVLNEAYPQDVTANSAGEETTFEVVIAEAGTPAEYTYQWYYDGTAVDGANSGSYTRVVEFGDHTVHCVVSNEAGSVISRTATVTANTQYLFYYGDKKTDVTGGWTAESRKMASDVNYTTSVKITNQTGGGVRLENSGLGGCVYRTTNKVDLTNANTIKLNGNIHGGNADNAHWAGLYVWSAMGSGYNQNVAASTHAKNTTVSNPSLDVSKLSGLYYIGFGLYASGAGASYATMNTLAMVR